MQRSASRSVAKRLSFDSLEERTMLSITIAALGDSVTDEYQFYAPYRTAAMNWPEIISTLRPTQVSSGAFLGDWRWQRPDAEPRVRTRLGALGRNGRGTRCFELRRHVCEPVRRRVYPRRHAAP